jgi:hypothetical protein
MWVDLEKELCEILSEESESRLNFYEPGGFSFIRRSGEKEYTPRERRGGFRSFVRSLPTTIKPIDVIRMAVESGIIEPKDYRWRHRASEHRQRLREVISSERNRMKKSRHRAFRCTVCCAAAIHHRCPGG